MSAGVVPCSIDVRPQSIFAAALAPGLRNGFPTLFSTCDNASEGRMLGMICDNELLPGVIIAVGAYSSQLDSLLGVGLTATKWNVS